MNFCLNKCTENKDDDRLKSLLLSPFMFDYKSFEMLKGIEKFVKYDTKTEAIRNGIKQR